MWIVEFIFDRRLTSFEIGLIYDNNNGNKNNNRWRL